jgi:hypothetical protein
MGAWTAPHPIDPASVVGAYLDQSHELGAYWVDLSGDGRDTRTEDGTTFDAVSAPTTFTPGQGTSITLLHDPSPGGRVWMVNPRSTLITLAYLDPMTADWVPFVGTGTPFVGDVGATIVGGYIVLAGPGQQGELCEISFDLTNDVWTTPHCDMTIPVASGQTAEGVPITGPIAVGVPVLGGLLVVVYAVPGGGISAVERMGPAPGSAWMPPWGPVTGPEVGVIFAAAAFPSGETGMVEVGLISPYGDVSTMELRPAIDPEVPSGWWTTPMVVDHAASELGPIAVCPGICGDDALVAYAWEVPEGPHTTRVARVRGGAAATHDVFSGWTPMTAQGLSIAKRGVGE